jgi:hypothetical protein
MQWEVSIDIKSPLKKVWDAMDDLTLIPRYHPDVRTVEFVSGQTKRAAGVSYKCIVPEGRKGWCVERVIEHVPYRKTSIDFPSDSWGISKMFSNFVTDIEVTAIDNSSTRVRLAAYYEPIGFLNKLMNIIFIRRMMQRRASLMAVRFKNLVEREG